MGVLNEDDRAGAEGSGNADDSINWPRRRPPLVPGTRISYRSRRVRAGMAAVRQGTIAGPPLRDAHTNTTWVPVRPRGAADDQPPVLIRDLDIA